MDVVISSTDIIDGNESLPRLKRTVYRGYGDSKSEAEGVVIEANQSTMGKSYSFMMKWGPQT